MTTKLEIISSANILLGNEEILDLEEVPEQVALFDLLLVSHLQSNTWKFATSRLQLSKLVDKPLYEFSNQFELPSDFLRLVGYKDHMRYSINGSRLLTDNEEVFIEYIRKVEVDECPASNVLCLQYLMAAEIALLITEDPAKANFFTRKAAEQRKVAAGIDMVQGQSRPVFQSQFEMARRSGSSDWIYLNNGGM